MPLHPLFEPTIGWWRKELCAKPTPPLSLALQELSDAHHPAPSAEIPFSHTDRCTERYREKLCVFKFFTLPPCVKGSFGVFPDLRGISSNCSVTLNECCVHKRSVGYASWLQRCNVCADAKNSAELIKTETPGSNGCDSHESNDTMFH